LIHHTASYPIEHIVRITTGSSLFPLPIRGEMAVYEYKTKTRTVLMLDATMFMPKR